MTLLESVGNDGDGRKEQDLTDSDAASNIDHLVPRGVCQSHLIPPFVFNPTNGKPIPLLISNIFVLSHYHYSRIYSRGRFPPLVCPDASHAAQSHFCGLISSSTQIR